MITQPLDILQPRRQVQSLEKLVVQKYRLARRSIQRSIKQLLRFISSQYYLTTAIADTRYAISLNEDIALASFIIIAVISFSTISILGNAIYTFVIGADAAATISGVSLALLMLVSLGVIAVLLGWLAAMLQNMLSISLMEGLTRKQKRSLRLTIRRSLRAASRTTAAWVVLLAAAISPIVGLALVAGGIASFVQPTLSTALPYIIGLGIICLAWLAWIMANYTLVPYVMLFDNNTGWRESFAKSRQLVQHKGQCFLLSGYTIFALSMAGLYLLAVLIQKLTHFNSTLMFMMFSATAITVANAILTVFYRKRKIARK